MAKALKAPVDTEPNPEAAADDTISPVARVARSMPKMLPAHDIHPEGVSWGRWAVTAHADHAIEDVLHPRYLYAKHEHFRPLDCVEIKHPYGLFVVCLDILKVDRSARGIVAYVRNIYDYTQAAHVIAPDLSGARVEFLGGREWSVVDGHHVVKDEFRSRAAAEQWLAEERRAMSGR